MGIFGKQASNLTIVNNAFENDGITLYPYDTGYHTRPTLSKKHFVHTIDNNTVNGNPLLYYVDKNDFVNINGAYSKYFVKIKGYFSILFSLNCFSCNSLWQL